MEILRRNIVWSLLGGLGVGFLTLLITPLQVNLLGMEAYGLLGFIIALQVVMGVFDLGLSSTVTHEIASDPSPGNRASLQLLRTATTLYWSLALLIGAVLATAAGNIARVWFRPDTIQLSELVLGLQITALFIALRWPVALYSGVLIGIQRLDILNLVKVGTISARLLGGIVVLLIWRELTAFLVWIALTSILEVVAFMIACRAVFPGWDWRPGFSVQILRRVWRFSLTMSALGALSIGITQLDRLLVSSMLPLQELGYYSLAHTVALALTLVLSAFSTALMPSFASAHAADVRDELLQRYDVASRMVVFVTGAIFFPLLFFGDTLLSIWVGPNAAAGASLPLAILAAGYWLSCVASNPSTLAVACRKPQLPLQVTAICALFYVPLLYVLIVNWGIVGAAIAWVCLFGSCTLILIPIVHRQLLGITSVPWYANVVLPTVLLRLCTFGAVKVAVAYAEFSQVGSNFAAIIFAATIYSGAGLFFVGVEVRTFMLTMARRIARSKLLYRDQDLSK